MKRLIVAAATCLFAAPAIANDTGFASSHTLRREGGRLCMADHFHGGSGAGGSKVVAYTMAMKGWYDTL